MSDQLSKTVLPAGFVDLVPPVAAFEAEAVESLICVFAGYGYERVKPPLIEFEDRLLAGSGAALAGQTIRMMDPLSQRMLALRPDMTMQVARIASERLGRRPRPLRLSYAGQVVRVRGSQLRPVRQFGQVGAEIIGTTDPGADAEVLVMACDALSRLGVQEITVDLGLPTLIPALLPDLRLSETTATALNDALDRKDSAAVTGLGRLVGAERSRLLATLIDLVGPAEQALAALTSLTLPQRASRELASLLEVIGRIREIEPDLMLGVDLVERRGFEYHTGVTFALFARGARKELGRGGRYLSHAGDATSETGEGVSANSLAVAEPATGITLYLDMVLDVAAMPTRPRRILVPGNASPGVTKALRADGWVTVTAFTNTGRSLDDVDDEARRLSCSHVLDGDRPRCVQPDPVNTAE